MLFRSMVAKQAAVGLQARLGWQQCRRAGEDVFVRPLERGAHQPEQGQQQQQRDQQQADQLQAPAEGRGWRATDSGGHQAQGIRGMKKLSGVGWPEPERCLR